MVFNKFFTNLYINVILLNRIFWTDGQDIKSKRYFVVHCPFLSPSFLPKKISPSLHFFHSIVRLKNPSLAREDISNVLLINPLFRFPVFYQTIYFCVKIYFQFLFQKYVFYCLWIIAEPNLANILQNILAETFLLLFSSVFVRNFYLTFD